MIKTTLTVFSIFCLMTSTPNHSQAADSTPRESTLLQEDAQESQKLKAACEEVIVSDQDLVKTTLQNNQSLPSKKDYQRVFEGYKKYPLVPESAWRGLREILSHPQSHETLDLSPIYGTYNCSPIAIFDTAKLLIMSATPLGLSKAEKATLVQSVLARVSADMTSGRPSLFQFLTDFNLVTMMMGQGFLSISDSIYTELMRLDVDAIHLKKDLDQSYSENNKMKKFSEMSKDDQKIFRQTFFQELQGADSLRLRLKWLLVRIKPASQMG